MASLDFTQAYHTAANRADQLMSEILDTLGLLEQPVKAYQPVSPIERELCESTASAIEDMTLALHRISFAVLHVRELLDAPFIDGNGLRSEAVELNSILSAASKLCFQICRDIARSGMIGLADQNGIPFGQTIMQLDQQYSQLRTVCQEITTICEQAAETSEGFTGSFTDFDSAAIPEPDCMITPPYCDSDCDSSASAGHAPANSTLSAPPMPAPAPAPAPPVSFGASDKKQDKTAVKVKPVKVDSVAFSVLSPDRVKKGEYSSINVYMYTKSQRKLIEKAIKAAEQKVNETEKSGFSVSRGSEVSIVLHSDDVEITENVDTRTWDGKCVNFDFQFLVPENYAKKQAAFTCYVHFNGIQITRLHFTVKLAGAAKSVPVKVKRKDCRKAFVSYCHADTKRVLAQLNAISEVAPQLVFWMDTQSLEAGDVWRKEITRAINRADVMLLFWSVNSMKSSEVKKEWTYALKKKGLRFIAPVPLDHPSVSPPPKELSSLHFARREFAYTDEMDSLKFVSSRQFKEIK